MPYSVNGIGTGLVAASKKRTVDGHVQFDAIEALMVFHLPLIPYKAQHVLSIWSDAKDYQAEQYQSVKLRFSPRLVLKAFFNRWGNVLAIFGPFMGAIAGFAFMKMDRPFNHSDAMLLIVSGAMFVVGVVFKLMFWVLDGRDERIKNALGPHELGSSDPMYWTDEDAANITENILTTQGQSSLVDVARRALAEGNRGLAILAARLAMRDKNNVEAEALFGQLLYA